MIMGYFKFRLNIGCASDKKKSKLLFSLLGLHFPADNLCHFTENLDSTKRNEYEKIKLFRICFDLFP